MKQKISIAANQLKPKDMSRTHFTTLGFGVPFPIFIEEAINKDKFSMRVSNFSRLAPMYLPNLGTLTMKIHAFYVPFRLVWNHFENFREGLPSWNSQGANVYKNVPLIDDVQLTLLFTRNISSNPNDNLAKITDGDPDFIVYENQAGGYIKYQFTAHGKQVYHMLISLGYNFKFLTSDAVTDFGAENTEYSLLPLLCWFKTFLDYFIPSQLQPSSYINKLFNDVHELTASNISTPVGYDSIGGCIREIYLYYQNNYFTSAWMNPNAPVPGLNNIGSTGSDIPVINSVKSQTNLNEVDEDSFKQGLRNSSNSVENRTLQNDSILTSDGITFMQKFARFVKRSNFAGSRAVERILARFGVRVEDFQIGMCRYLGSEDLQLQKSDVTVTGNTEQAGEFVGKGFFSGGSQRVFKCDCDLAGMVIISASLMPPSTFVDGVRRRNLHKTPLDFYTPELDGSTMQAISGCEIYHRNQFINENVVNDFEELGLNYTQTFGFSPRYSEYKSGSSIDDVTGDFALPRYSQNIDAFILPRRLFNYDEMSMLQIGGNHDDYSLKECAYDNYIKEGNKVTPVRTLYCSDMVQFNRIFKDLTGMSDPVFSVFRIDCVVNSVALPLNESAEIIGKGKALEFETNGVHLS